MQRSVSILRDFDKEGYARGYDAWKATNALVMQAIVENLHENSNKVGLRQPKKWMRTVTISDWNTDRQKIKKIGGLMGLLVYNSSRTRVVRDVARAIIRGYNVESKDYPNELWALQHWIQNNIRYTFDTGEQVQTPFRVLIDWANGHDGADCDCSSMLYLSLASAMGHRKLAVGLVDSRGDGTISHAIALVKLPKYFDPWGERWIPIELTKCERFGWLTPKATKVIAVPLKGA
jgi:hypothetical protein